MNNYEQEPSFEIHLKKAKKVINFLLVLFFITLLPTIAFGKLGQLNYINVTSFVVLIISSRIIFKYPFFAVITLGFMVLFYLHGWYNFLYKTNLISEPRDFLLYFILIFRIFATLIVFRGFYLAIKGMNAKEHFEKTHGTLDEYEI